MAKVKINPEQYDELTKLFALRGDLAETYDSLLRIHAYVPEAEKTNIVKVTDYISRLFTDNSLQLEGMIEEGEFE